MTIREVREKEKKVIKQVVSIHLDTFKGFFLTFMGKGFLTQMYRAYTRHDPSKLLIAEEEGRVVGFLAYSGELSALYKFMLKKQLFAFAWYSLGAFIRKPKIFMRLIRAFLKPGESAREEKYVKLTSIGVSPNSKSKGVGSKLIDEMKNMVDFSIYEYISLETDAEDNVVANNFYLKNGFSFVKEYQTNEGRKMNEYRYSEEKV